MEGSATDAELERLEERGPLAHTNHYACARMTATRAIRRTPGAQRCGSAGHGELLDAAPDGSIDAAWLRGALADHETTPSICRHAEQDSRVATAFWCVVDVTAGDIRYGLGNPCAGRRGAVPPSPDVEPWLADLHVNVRLR